MRNRDYIRHYRDKLWFYALYTDKNIETLVDRTPSIVLRRYGKENLQEQLTLLREDAKVNIYLDDVRKTPEGYIRCYSVNEVKDWLRTGNVQNMSLDHDLGEFEKDGGSGYTLVKWMAEKHIWPKGKIKIHSMNIPGKVNMLSTIERYRYE